MFKKFTTEDISSFSQAKTSVQRNVRKKIIDLYPSLNVVNDILDNNNDNNNNNTTTEIDYLLPKKTPLYIIKSHGHIQLLAINNTITFFTVESDNWLPALYTLHSYPELLPKWQVDKGAIKFVLSGAHVMCPGLTHKDSHMVPLQANQYVAIYAAGFKHAMAIGKTVMSDNDVRDINKGVAVEIYHHMLDGLWHNKTIDTK